MAAARRRGADEEGVKPLICLFVSEKSAGANAREKFTAVNKWQVVWGLGGKQETIKGEKRDNTLNCIHRDDKVDVISL